MLIKYAMTLILSILVLLQVYRRFQISFQSVSEALGFIDSIRPVCPCKINPLSVIQGISQTHTLVPARQPAIRPQAANASSILPDRGSALSYPAVPSIHLNSGQTKLTTSAHQPPSAFTLSSSPLNHQSPSDPHSSLGLNITNSPNSSPTFDPIQTNRPDQTLPQALHSAQIHFPSTHNTSPTLISYPSSSLPMASSEQSSGSSGQPPNTAQSVKENNTQQTANAILASITETASVYDLPVSSLERLVGEIIREDGFVQLVVRFILIIIPSNIFISSKPFRLCGQLGASSELELAS
jgi:hypothetical protein